MHEIETIGTLIVGLGLCYIGVQLLASYINQASGHTIRAKAVRKAPNFLRDGFIGGLFSFLSAETHTLSLMTSSWTSCRIIHIDKAFSMLLVGAPASLLLTYFSLMMTTAAAFLSGLMLLCCRVLNPQVKTQTYVGVIVGLGLIYYGAQVTLDASTLLARLPWVSDSFQSSFTTHASIFTTGALLGGILQPLIIPLLFIISLASVEILNSELLFCMLTGLYLGQAVYWYLHSQNLQRFSKQIALFQSFISSSACIVGGISLFLEQVFSLALLSSLTNNIALNSAQSAIHLSILCLLLGNLFLLIFLKPIKKYLSNSVLDDKKIQTSETAFINEIALNDPDSAMDLVEREQFRLIRRLPLYMQVLRSRDLVQILPQLENFHRDLEQLSSAIHEYLSKLASKEQSHESFERQLNLMHRQNTLMSTEKKIYHMCKDIAHMLSNDNLHELLINFSEALDIILIMIRDAIDSLLSEDLELLYTITYNREEQMKDIRKQYLSKESHLELNERAKLLEIIVTFEKCVWLSRQLATLLKESDLFDLDEAASGEKLALEEITIH